MIMQELLTALVLPWEDAGEFRRFHEEMEAGLQPAGIRERLLFEEMVWAGWRLRRARVYEAAIAAALVEFDAASADGTKELGLRLIKDAEGRRTLEYAAGLEDRYRQVFRKAAGEFEKLRAAGTRRTEDGAGQSEARRAKLAIVSHNGIRLVTRESETAGSSLRPAAGRDGRHS